MSESRRALLAARLRVLDDPLPFVQLLAACPDEPTAHERLASMYGVSKEEINALLDLSFRRLVKSNRQRISEELRSLG